MTTSPESILAGMQPFVTFGKGSQTSVGAGALHSLWKAVGGPSAGVNPPVFSAGSGYVPTRTTQGAFPFNNPPNGSVSTFGHIWCWGATPGMLIVYDRLWACSGFGTVTTALQSVVTPGDVGRYPTGDGVEMFLEIYTQTGGTAATWTITYTNSAGVANRTATYSHPASAEIVGKMIPLALAAGDTGVRSAQSLQCSASSGTAGDVGITLARKLGAIPIRTDGMTRDAFEFGLERVLDDACIALQVGCSTTNTGLIQGQLKLSHYEP